MPKFSGLRVAQWIPKPSFYPAFHSHIPYLNSARNPPSLTISPSTSPLPKTHKTRVTMILRESRRTGGHTNKAQTKRHNTPLAHLDPLSVLYPLTPSITLTLPRVLRYHEEHAGKSGSPAASKQKRRKGNFFEPNHQKKGKKRIFCFSCENETNESEIESLQLCFCFSIVLCILIFLPFSSHKR